MDTRCTSRLFALTLLALLAASLAYAWHLGDRLRYPDEHEYTTLAHQLATQGRFTLDGNTPTAYRPPGYPVLMAVCAKLGGETRSFRVLNSLALVASVALLHALARRAGASPLHAMLGAAVMAAYPLNLYTAGTLYPQTLLTTMTLAALWVLWRPGTLADRHAAAFGILAGLQALTVPTALAPMGALGAWALWQRAPAVRRIRLATLMLSFSLLVLLPWSLRNLRVLDAWVPVSTNSGINLLLGNSPGTTPTAGVNVDLGEHVRAAAMMNEVQRDRYYKTAARANIREEPLRYGLLYVLKWLNHFNVYNRLHTADEAGAWQPIVLGVFYVPLLALACRRAWRAARTGGLGAAASMLVLLYLVQAAAQAVFFTRLRFRVPYDPLLILACCIPALSGVGGAAVAARTPAQTPDS